MIAHFIGFLALGYCFDFLFNKRLQHVLNFVLAALCTSLSLHLN